MINCGINCSFDLRHSHLRVNGLPSLHDQPHVCPDWQLRVQVPVTNGSTPSKHFSPFVLLSYACKAAHALAPEVQLAFRTLRWTCKPHTRPTV